MYRTIQHQMSIDDYLPPYEGELVQENRWVRCAPALGIPVPAAVWRQAAGLAGLRPVPAPTYGGGVPAALFLHGSRASPPSRLVVLLI